MDQGGDYLLAVKSNQGKLREAIVKAFAFQRANNTEKSVIEHGHGRTECRQCYVIDSKNLVGDFSTWKGLKYIIMVENCRLEKGKPIELEYRYYVSGQ